MINIHEKMWVIKAKERDHALQLSREMAGTLHKKNLEVERQAKALAYFHNMSFWQRLKFLFTGEA